MGERRREAYSIGQLLVFLIEILVRVVIRSGAPVVTSVLKSLVEAQRSSAYMSRDAGSSCSKSVGDAGGGWYGFGGLGLLRGSPRGGVRPGIGQVLEAGRYIMICGGKRHQDNATVPNTQIYDRLSGRWDLGGVYPPEIHL